VFRPQPLVHSGGFFISVHNSKQKFHQLTLVFLVVVLLFFFLKYSKKVIDRNPDRMQFFLWLVKDILNNSFKMSSINSIASKMRNSSQHPIMASEVSFITGWDAPKNYTLPGGPLLLENHLGGSNCF